MLQKSYSEGVGAGFQLTENVRFQLAKTRVNDLFIRWLTQPQTQKLVQILIKDAKDGKQNNLIAQPNAFFINKMAMSGVSQSALFSSPNKKSQGPSSPPKTDPFQDLKLRIPEDLSQSLTQSQILQKKCHVEEAKNYELVPQFYFPTQEINLQLQLEQNKIINEIFGKQDFIDAIHFEQITTILCGLCKYLTKILMVAIESNTTKISKSGFLKYWNQHLAQKEPKKRCFQILKKQTNDYIQFEDFKPFMKILLQEHPGLEFLQATPEFQERYADTVIHRIFYHLCRKDNDKITWRDFKQSNLFDVLDLVGKEEDINKIRQYFSYEHFYVIYCKFWELDGDHDFHISKEDFSRYSSHGLSRKVVDRIFDQIPRRFRSQIDQKMSYEDFVYFIQCEEDKTTIQSIEYWFKVIDLDNNGIITGFEMDYFYEELKQRMDYLNHEPILFQDFVCQMVDLLHPDNDILFKLNHFKQNLTVCGVFFNFLTNLNKLVAYENRDPFQVRNDIVDHPDFNDWDRFAFQEYVRLAMEEENQEQGEVFEGDNIWDNDDSKQL
ncbi:unnamed protein product [Paramecium primaurelia]|uniref:EF-hand domain-containing protein n=1 Tax=Paramecium primaurelia TaxID=5886 RepID=A0A8S1JSH9_PARPR|nr:unnamed protein product [Paramecium primaurelia]